MLVYYVVNSIIALSVSSMWSAQRRTSIDDNTGQETQGLYIEKDSIVVGGIQNASPSVRVIGTAFVLVIELSGQAPKKLKFVYFKLMQVLNWISLKKKKNCVHSLQ